MSILKMSWRGGPRLRTPVQPDDHVLGNADAPVTLVEYGEFECPFCYLAYPVVRALRQRLGASMRFVFRNFPISDLHPRALAAAETAESVAAHAGEAAYWRMHDALLTRHQSPTDALNEAHLLDYAAAAGADRHRVKADLARRVHVERVRSDSFSGVRSGVNGAPTFFINGERFDGDWRSVNRFAHALETAAFASAQRTSA